MMGPMGSLFIQLQIFAKSIERRFTVKLVIVVAVPPHHDPAIVKQLILNHSCPK